MLSRSTRWATELAGHAATAAMVVASFFALGVGSAWAWPTESIQLLGDTGFDVGCWRGFTFDGSWVEIVLEPARADVIESGHRCSSFSGMGIAFLGLAAVVVVALARFRSQLEQRRLELARHFVEAGREVPRELLAGLARNDLRRGLVLEFASLGLLAAALVSGERWLAPSGLVPAFIGIGYLVSYRVARRGGAA